MVTKYNQNINVETYENKLDLSLFRKKGNSKTYEGWIIQKMKEARQEGNLDVCELLQNCYKKFMEFKTHEEVLLKSWKGKSSLEIINNPDYFTIITYQKKDKDSMPEEIKRDITKLEINRIINVINKLDKGEKISTRDIGEEAYRREWDKIFADRFLHTNLNLILRLLDYFELTHYRGKYTKVLKRIREIQEVLK